MSRTHKDQRRRGHAPKPERRVTVRGVRREPMDYRKMARALIALAQAEVDAEAARPTNTAGSDSAAPRDHPPEAA
jgi:hypothetical protein